MARVLISMPEEFLDRIDQVAEGENRTRSELIREALRSYMYKSRVKANTMAGKNAALFKPKILFLFPLLCLVLQV